MAMLQKIYTEFKTTIIALLISLAIFGVLTIVALMFLSPLLPVTNSELMTGKISQITYETPYDPHGSTTIRKPKLTVILDNQKKLFMKGKYRIYHVGEDIRLKKISKTFGITEYELAN